MYSCVLAQKYLLSLEPVSSLPPISHLNLSYSSIGDANLILLASVLTCNTPYLLHLDLCFTNVTHAAIHDLTSALTGRCNRSLPPLKSLALSGNTLTGAAEELGVTLGAIYARHQSATPPPNKSYGGLKSLYVSCCSLGSKGLLALLTGMGPNYPLVDFVGSSNNVGTDGALRLCEFFAAPKPTEPPPPLLPPPLPPPPLAPPSQFLSHPRRAIATKKTAHVLPSLTSLDLSRNDFGSDATVKLAVSLFPRPTLAHLKLCQNDISAGGVEKIFQQLLRVSAAQAGELR